MAVPHSQWSDANCGELEPLMVGRMDLSVLSFNMNILPFGVARLRGHESLHSSQRLQSFLQRLQEEAQGRAPDVIAVQELFASPFVPFACAQSHAVRVMAQMGYHAVIGPKPSLLDLLVRGKWTDSGLVIFSRWPSVDSRSIRFSAGAALDAGACKGAMWARCSDVILTALRGFFTVFPAFLEGFWMLLDRFGVDFGRKG